MGDAAAASQRKAFLEGLKDLIWKTYELEETVQNFGADTQEVLEERMLQYISGVRTLAQSAPAFEGVKIPADMLRCLDEGGNPHQYTAEAFQACTRDNQVAKGKAQAIGLLRDSLLMSLAVADPAGVAEYKAILSNKH